MSFSTRFVAYDPLGARRGVLRDILQATVVPTKNELPTLTLQYPRNRRTSPHLENSPEVAFEFYNKAEKRWVEPANARFRLVSRDFDYLEEVATRTYTFIGIGEGLRGIYVYGTNGLPRNEEGKLQFTKSTAGTMMAHVWDYATQRGWKGLNRNFTADHDSEGRNWDTELSLSFADDTSLDALLMYLTRLGLVDFEWEGRALQAYNGHKEGYRDLTVGNNPVRMSLSGGPAGIDSAPENNDFENRATHVIVVGEEGLRWEFPTGAILPEGRREVFLSFSGVDDEGTARILAQPTIAKYSSTLTNTTRQFQITSETRLFPYIDYGIGDWVLVEKDEGNWERMQVFQLSLMVTKEGVQGYVSLGDKIDSYLEILDERVQRIQGGTLNEGVEKPEPSASKPLPPQGLVVTATTMADSQGVYQGVVGVNFSHIGEDIYTRPINVDHFIVEYDRGTDTWSELFTIASPSQSGTYSWLPVLDSTGEEITYKFRVIAVSSKQQRSDPSEVVSITMDSDKEAPDVPKAPTVAADQGVFRVTVSHTTDDGNAFPNDYSHLIIQRSQFSSSTSTTWIEVGAAVPPSTFTYVSGEGNYDTWWFRTIAVDRAGNRSQPSKAVSATLQQLVDKDIVLKRLNGAIITDDSIVARSLKVTEEMMVKLLSVYKIKANDIDVNNLAASYAFIQAVRTNVLTANVIKAEMIDSDAITAKHTITGAYIRTAITGQRTIMNEYGIRVISEEGHDLVRLGQGLKNGMAVYNPYTKQTVSLQSHVFGSRLYSGKLQREYYHTGEQDKLLRLYPGRDKRLGNLPIYDRENTDFTDPSRPISAQISIQAISHKHLFLVNMTASATYDMLGYGPIPQPGEGLWVEVTLGHRETGTTGQVYTLGTHRRIFMSYEALHSTDHSFMFDTFMMDEGKYYDLFMSFEVDDHSENLNGTSKYNGWVEVDYIDFYLVPLGGY